MIYIVTVQYLLHIYAFVGLHVDIHIDSNYLWLLHFFGEVCQYVSFSMQCTWLRLLANMIVQIFVLLLAAWYRKTAVCTYWHGCWPLPAASHDQFRYLATRQGESFRAKRFFFVGRKLLSSTGKYDCQYSTLLTWDDLTAFTHTYHLRWWHSSRDPTRSRADIRGVMAYDVYLVTRS